MTAEELQSSGTDWRRVLMIALMVLGAVLLAVVFLVLTGIIAEPETVIENILRTVSGG